MSKRISGNINLQDKYQSQVWSQQVADILKYLTFGSGVPSGAPTSGNGTIYIRLDGGASTTLYIYEGGSWVAK